MSQPGGEVEFVVETLDFEKTLREFGATALVLDIEGSEVDLLTNAMEFGAVKTIVMETHPAFVGNDNIRSMLERLERAGFRIAEHTSGGAVVALRR